MDDGGVWGTVKAAGAPCGGGGEGSSAQAETSEQSETRSRQEQGKIVHLLCDTTAKTTYTTRATSTRTTRWGITERNGSMATLKAVRQEMRGRATTGRRGRGEG